MFQFFIQILFILYHIIDHFLLISKLTTHYSVLFFTYLYISLTNKPVIPFEILWGIPASLIYNVTQYSQKFDNLDIPLINTIRDRVLLSPSPGVRLRSWTCRDSISPFLGIFPNKKSCKIFLIFTVRLSYTTKFNRGPFKSEGNPKKDKTKWCPRHRKWHATEEVPRSQA
jgi:hypothetical protein